MPSLKVVVTMLSTGSSTFVCLSKLCDRLLVGLTLLLGDTKQVVHPLWLVLLMPNTLYELKSYMEPKGVAPKS